MAMNLNPSSCKMCDSELLFFINEVKIFAMIIKIGLYIAIPKYLQKVVK